MSQRKNIVAICGSTRMSSVNLTLLQIVAERIKETRRIIESKINEYLQQGITFVKTKFSAGSTTDAKTLSEIDTLLAAFKHAIYSVNPEHPA